MVFVKPSISSRFLPYSSPEPPTHGQPSRWRCQFGISGPFRSSQPHKPPGSAGTSVGLARTCGHQPQCYPNGYGRRRHRGTGLLGSRARGWRGFDVVGLKGNLDRSSERGAPGRFGLASGILGRSSLAGWLVGLCACVMCVCDKSTNHQDGHSVAFIYVIGRTTPARPSPVSSRWSGVE